MTETRLLLRNIARRPIERHDGGIVTIFPADATIEVDEIDDAHAALIERGLMTVHPAPAAPPAAPAAPSPRRTRKKTRTTKAPAAPAAGSARQPRKTAKAPAKAKTPTKTSRRKGEGA